jgi:predicted permease
MKEPMWRRYLRFIRPDVAQDVDDEVRFHLESRIQELVARGLSPEAARRAARDRFGDVETVAEWLRTHDRRRQRATTRRDRRRMLVHHWRYAARGLRKQPGFTAAAVLTLALGIGATTAIFAVVDGVLLSPLPYPDPSRLVTIWHRVGGEPGQLPISQALFTTYRRFGHGFSALAAHVETAVNLTEGSAPERVAADSATPELFTVLGVTPIIGRSFTEADQAPGHPAVALIDERLWRSRFAASAAVIGSTLRIDDVPHQVIGVLPARTSFPAGARVWLPLGFDPNTRIPIGFNYSAVGRLAPGVEPGAAARELDAVIPRLPELFANALPGMPAAGWIARAQPRVTLHALRDDIVGDVDRLLWVVFGTFGFVLVAASANIANLFLARAESRRGELAVHAALGAERPDLIGRFMAEALILAGAGAALGAALAAAGLGWVRRSDVLAIPRLAEVHLAGRAFAVTGGVTISVALFTAWLPIGKIRLANVATLLREGSRGAGVGRDRRRVQRGLVVTQVALAYVLLTACALLTRTFLELSRVRLGFDPKPLLAFRVALPAATYPDLAATIGFYRRMEQRLATLPGVSTVGFVANLPLEPGRRNSSTILAEGDIEPEQEATAVRTILLVSDRFPAALGVPLVAGRMLESPAVDTAGTRALVNLAFARIVWGDPSGAAAIGRRLHFLPTAPPITVVGVLDDIRDQSLGRAPSPSVYLPLNSPAFRGGLVAVPRATGVLVRGSVDPASLIPAVRRELAALDPGLPLERLAPLTDLVSASKARTSIIALLLGISSLVALILGAVGLFGIVSYTVGSHRREIGVRVALGASPGGVVRSLARNGAALAGAGIGLGMAGASIVTRGLRTLLYGVGPMDLLTLTTVGVGLLGVAVLASWIPARRAGRIAPASVLAGD